MNAKYLLIFCLLFFSNNYAQQQQDQQKPKLVVGIVVDQMRYDYLTRFWDRFEDDGFKRLVNEGFNFRNHHFNYVPTYTGPGHASVWTGTTPMNHGIIGNNWFDKVKGESVYCTDDDSVSPIGTESAAGKMSPVLLKTTTITDQNRLHTQMKGKTIGVALKDRGSILPAGHTANAAYWFHGGTEGKFITSSFYRDDLPKWVQDFNDSGKVESYLKEWNTLYDIGTYTASGIDENNFEGGFEGKEKTTFPYDLNALSSLNGNFGIISSTPYGNDLTTDFALAALKGEKLGQDNITDFLTLSFSSTDYVGHNFGVNSKEVEDTYLRLDKNIAELLEFLDNYVGKGDYTIFLTADHGAVDVPSYLQSVKIPGGYFDDIQFTKALEEYVLNEFSAEDLIQNISNNQIFFNYDKLREANISIKELENSVAFYCIQQTQVDKVITRSQLNSANFNSGIRELIQNGFNQKRSGDVVFVLNPATIVYSKTGSTHGSGLTYDTHAPLIFFGAGVKPGSTTERSEIPDITPTVASLLNIAFPNGASGAPLHMMLDQ
ncbi:alkaline phosphatase [Salegentibacter salinarum]|uniref:Alkaline phosphatase n=1 Tax=Salegentibacter salinarum TaxID=447422 RepID=A0A2N0TVP6_9FLAO|nr:alkaline phosphatase PafA [Salegentibacter salinarum]PKD18813.1 alkaline phosphatase [Salegentibacter salinarum]SKB97875.1 Predicted pyrophosphatase or phosphodiesterase, AlkP superfamily [Salegentibacter salinarum]